VGSGAYEKGVYQVMVYPGTPGTHPAFFSCPQKIEGIEAEAEKTGQGYRMKALIPFASFCVEAGVPEKVGFDVGVNTADSSGNRIGQWIFAGSGENWHDASGFLNVYLV
jgi:hypothetical protein